MLPFSKFRFVEPSIPHPARRRYGKQKIPKPIGLRICGGAFSTALEPKIFSRDAETLRAIIVPWPQIFNS